EKIDGMLTDQAAIKDLRDFLDKIYNKVGGESVDLDSLSDDDIMALADNLRDGVPMGTAVFDGAHEYQVKELVELAGMDRDGQQTLYDGRTGQKFDRKVTVGYVYVLKLNHLVN